MRSAKIPLLLLALAVLAYNWQGIFFSAQSMLGNLQYSAGDLPHALESYERARPHASWSGALDRLRYNEANALYQKKLYTGAKKIYESIRSDDSELDRMIAYNLGNTLYRIGESTSGSGHISAWQSSLASYEHSLTLREDTKTRENYEFVKKKLAEETKAEEKRKEEGKKEKDEKDESKKEDKTGGSGSGRTGTGSQSQSWSGKSSDQAGKSNQNGQQNNPSTGSQQSGSQPQPWQNWTNQGGYNPVAGGSGADEQKLLSPDEIRELESYGASLKNFQKQNGKYLNPDPANPGNTSGFMDQFFGNNPMLRDALPGNEQERDW